MASEHEKQKMWVKIKIIACVPILMFCFFNCGQPGTLGLAIPEGSNSTLGDVPTQTNQPTNSPTTVPADTPTTVDIPGSSPPGVNEAINNMKPALAVRATGCIMCHSQVNSNIITDFGYGGDGRGNNYFFGGYPGKNLPSGLTNTEGGSAYGDYDFSTVGNVNWGGSTLQSGTQVIVPQASTTGLKVSESSLAKYLTNIIGRSANANGVSVQEVKSVFIGAPTTDKIVSLPGFAVGQIKYVPKKIGTTFSGISKNASYFSNKKDETIVCDGDVIIDGIVYLNNAKFKTDDGCRLYVTGSVFVTGPISYVSQTDKSNVQITSAKMVALGVGHDCDRNDPGARDDHSDSINERLTQSSSAENRYGGFFTRTLGKPSVMLAALKSEADLIDPALLKDGACGIGGRNIDFTRLMVNAPIVHNRYKGQFKGLIVAEIAMLALMALKYEFDPVFSDPKVKILPLLKSSDFLEIEK